MVLTRCIAAAVVLCLALCTASCGRSDRNGPGHRAAPPSAESSAPALVPGGPYARTVAYICRSGRRASVVVDIPDPEDLAETLTSIQPCEYDGGIVSFSTPSP